MKTGYEVKGREVTYLVNGKYWPVFIDDIGYYRLNYVWDGHIHCHKYIKAVSLEMPTKTLPIQTMFRDRKTFECDLN